MEDLPRRVAAADAQQQSGLGHFRPVRNHHHLPARNSSPRAGSFNALRMILWTQRPGSLRAMTARQAASLPPARLVIGAVSLAVSSRALANSHGGEGFLTSRTAKRRV